MFFTFLIVVALLAQTPALAQAPAPDPGYRIDPTTIALIGGMIVTIIGTIVTGVVTVITAMRINAVSAQGSQTADRLVTVAKDTEAIKGHVNSEKTAAGGRELALQQENRLLREMITDKTATASLLAQAAVGRATSRASDALVPAAPIPVEVVNAPLSVAQIVAPAEPPATESR